LLGKIVTLILTVKKRVHEYSPKISRRIHPKMSMKIPPKEDFSWKKVFTIIHPFCSRKFTLFVPAMKTGSLQ
jgi:hypothetical protein